MTRKSIVVLSAIVVGLMIAVLALQNGGRSDVASAGGKLLPDFSAIANDITEVIASGMSNSQHVTLRQEVGTWVVAERDNYPANVSKLRQVIVAIADARIVEEKTSNPDNYDKLIPMTAVTARR